MNLSNGAKINQKIRNRVKNVAEYIVLTRSTVREAAKKFNVSKSTVHVDISERLPLIDSELYRQVRTILDYHKSIRHLRGGEVTKKLYNKNKNMEKVIHNEFISRNEVSSA